MTDTSRWFIVLWKLILQGQHQHWWRKPTFKKCLPWQACISQDYVFQFYHLSWPVDQNSLTGFPKHLSYFHNSLFLPTSHKGVQEGTSFNSPAFGCSKSDSGLHFQHLKEYQISVQIFSVRNLHFEMELVSAITTLHRLSAFNSTSEAIELFLLKQGNSNTTLSIHVKQAAEAEHSGARRDSVTPSHTEIQEANMSDSFESCSAPVAFQMPLQKLTCSTSLIFIKWSGTSGAVLHSQRFYNIVSLYFLINIFYIFKSLSEY